MYMDLGLWMLVLNGLSGSPATALGLEHFTQSFPEPIRMTHTVPMIQV